MFTTSFSAIIKNGVVLLVVSFILKLRSLLLLLLFGCWGVFFGGECNYFLHFSGAITYRTCPLVIIKATSSYVFPRAG